MRLDAIWFRYARRADWTLRGVEAVAEPGQTVVVLGPNGAGKSTLLQVAAGVLRPTRGAVRDRPSVVGWVPERFPAEQPFATGGYLRSMAALRGLPADRADHWIERLGLTGHVHTPLGDLSKGTAQKVGLAQALLAPPGLLVLDEPWEGLDAGSRGLIPEIVGAVTAAGGVVLISDHRGEIANLPGAIHWTVTAGELRVEEPAAVAVAAATTTGADEVIMEIAVQRRAADAEMARLRASGHRILSVRPERAPAEEDR